MDTLHLENIDLSNIPAYIVNNLAKIDKEHLKLHNVTGLSCSMPKNVQCVELELDVANEPSKIVNKLAKKARNAWKLKIAVTGMCLLVTGMCVVINL